MQRFGRVLKRALVMLLTFAIILPVLTSTFVFSVAALNEEKYITKINKQATSKDDCLILEDIKLLGDTYASSTGDRVSYSVIEDLIVDNFFYGTDSGSKRAADILKSGALKTAWTGVKVEVTLPDAEGVVNLDGDVLTVDTYDSGYQGLLWTPYSYTVNNQTYLFDGKNEVVISDSKFDSVQIEYRLYLTNITDIQKILDLPATLASEADSQKSALDSLNLYYDRMAEIGSNKWAIDLLTSVVKSSGDLNGDGVIEDPDLDELHDALSGFSQNCFEGNSLKIYNLLTGYRKGGLAYYYKNSTKFQREIPVLNNYLKAIGRHKELLKTVVNDSLSAMLGSQIDRVFSAIDKIDALRVAIEALQKDLKAPNSAINLSSDNLDKLVKALELDGSIPKVQSSTMYLSTSIVKVADNMVSLNIKIQGATVAVPTFERGHVLTANDINSIIQTVESKMTALDYDSKYYDCNYSREVFTSLIGQSVTSLKGKKFEFEYSPKKFTIEIEGAADAVIDLDNLSIDLPECEVQGCRFEYIVFGKKISADKYTFTADEFNQIVDAGGYKITRVQIDVQQGKYADLINGLNKVVDNALITFALTEKDGEYSAVMKINLSDPRQLISGLVGIATEFIKHNYVAFSDNVMISTTENGKQISIQALLDAILESGFTSETFMGMMNSDGAINNMPMPGKVISDVDMSNLGALLAQTELCIGNSKEEINYRLPLYITVGAMPSSVVSLRNLFADFLHKYVSFKFFDGKVIFDIALPPQAYLACIPVLFTTKGVNILNIHSLNKQVELEFLRNLMAPVMNNEASIQNVQDAFARLGYKVNISKYEDAIRLVRNLYNGFAFESNQEGPFASIDIDAYIEKLNLDVIGNMIVEKGNGVNIPIITNVENLDKIFGFMVTTVTIIFVIVLVAALITTIALIEIRRKSSLTDSIPLVQYDINDDNMMHDIQDDNVNANLDDKQ